MARAAEGGGPYGNPAGYAGPLAGPPPRLAHVSHNRQRPKIGGAGSPNRPLSLPGETSPGKEREVFGTEKEVNRMERPLLSIGMIVKNEIRCIEKCLKALQPLREAISCQLVIADTGSNDGTREVAEQYADLLFDFNWVDDFSAARNAVLDRCTGKWYLTVDADEYLDPDFSQLTDFLTGPEKEQYAFASVKLHNYIDSDMKGIGVDFLACRIARMDQNPRYKGSIHESFVGVTTQNNRLLMNVILHHDGYARDSRHPERHMVKMHRNLDLLEKELGKTPSDLRRLLQCVETSNPAPALRIAYVRRAMKALIGKAKTPEGEIYGGIICSHAIGTAVEQGMPELEQWQRWAGTHYPDNIFLRLDGNFIQLKHWMKLRDYAKVPPLAEKFLAAWRDYQVQNFDLRLLTLSILQCTGRQFEVYARASGGEALARLGQIEEAVALLTSGDWENLKPAEAVILLKACAWVAGEESIQVFVSQGARVQDKKGGMDQDTFPLAAQQIFSLETGQDAPNRPWRLFTYVPGGLGQAVYLMEGERSDVEMALSQIQAQDWEDVPGPAVVRVVELGAVLPDAFFTQSRERLAELAAQISEALDITALLDWESRWDFTASMARFQFLFELLAAALRADKTWEEETEGQLPLCDRFLDVAGDYLPSYYNQELLTDEVEWTTLPGLHRFALHLLKGREAQAAGDELGCVRSLRAALKAAPAMKKAVSFLMDQLSKPVLVAEPSAELLALVEQVRTILSRYSDDDPAVVALKQSDVYKKVAYLIEGTGTPAFGGLPQ